MLKSDYIYVGIRGFDEPHRYVCDIRGIYLPVRQLFWLIGANKCKYNLKEFIWTIKNPNTGSTHKVWARDFERWTIYKLAKKPPNS